MELGSGYVDLQVNGYAGVDFNSDQLGLENYALTSQEVVVDEHLAIWSADRSYLVGSASTMADIVRNLREEVGLSHEEAERLTSISLRHIIDSDSSF